MVILFIFYCWDLITPSCKHHGMENKKSTEREKIQSDLGVKKHNKNMNFGMVKHSFIGVPA